MGSQQPKSVTQTNTVKLSPQQEELAALGFPHAQAYANQTLTMPNAEVLGFNPLEVEGQNAVVNAARGGMTDQVNTAADTNKWLMSKDMLDPNTNPWLKAQGDQIQRQGSDDFLQRVLPGLRSGAVSTGGIYGGGNTRQGLAQGLAAGETSKFIGDSLNTLYGNAYERGIQSMGAAVDRSGQVTKNLALPGTAIAGVGNQQRDLAQQQENVAAQQSWAEQNLPFLQAENIYKLMGMIPGGSGVSTVNGASPTTGGLGGAMGGALSGAAAGSMIMPGIGTALGGLAGGLAGWF